MKKLKIPLLLALLLAAHFTWLNAYVVPHHAGAGAGGSLVQARLLATQQRVTFRPESVLEHIGPEWLPVGEGRFAPTQPPGLASLQAAVWQAAGPEALGFLNPALATATLLFLFLLCRPWVGGGLALAAILLFGVHPLANQHAMLSEATTAATLFLVAGLWLLDAWGRGPTAWKALLAGLVLGALPAFRLPDVAAGLGVAAFLFLQAVRMTEQRRQILLVVLGAALPIGLHLAYNHVAYGAVWQTGYMLAGRPLPSLEGLAANWEPYLDGLMTGGVGLFFAFGLAGLAGMFVQPAMRPISACLGLAILGIVGFHAGTTGGSDSGFLALLLPALPLFLLPALWFFCLLGPGRVPRAALLILLALHLGRAIPDSMTVLEQERAAAEQSAGVVNWLEENVPPGSLLIGTPALHERIQFTGNWKLADKERVFPERIYSGWSPASLLRQPVELDEWAGENRTIYWAGTRREVEAYQGWYLGIRGYVAVGSVPLPEPLDLFLLRR